jgi:hypothetical protein
VKLEYLEVLVIEIPFGQQIEIGHILLVFAAPHAVALLPGAGLKGGAAEVLGLFGAFAKLRKARSKDTAKGAITGLWRPVSLSRVLAQSYTLAVRTGH